VIVIAADYTQSGNAPAVTSYDIAGRPSAIAVAGGTVWVADDERDVVWRLDEETGEPIRDPVPVPGDSVALDVSEGGDVVWLAHSGGSLTRIDVRTARVQTLSVEGLEALVSLAVAEQAVWLGDIAAGVIVAVDRDTGEVGDPIAVPDGVVRLAVADDTVWVTNLERTVTPIDVTSGRVGRPVEVGTAPIGLAVAAGRLWVANSEDDSVSRIDLKTRRPVGDPIHVGDAPVALAAAGDVVWAVSQEDRAATAIDASSGRIRGASIRLESRPRAVVVASGRAWIAGVDPNAAIVLR
jgi:DNA-binding beta-propeller fold protein YncE